MVTFWLTRRFLNTLLAYRTGHEQEGEIQYSLNMRRQKVKVVIQKYISLN
ncbi:MAG: hypothetical protein JNM68_11485 [Dinghuibacter sp.]|nr:hypothetical protein [Dinghuibacter sp.]